MGLFSKRTKKPNAELRQWYPYITSVFSSGLFQGEKNLAVDNSISLISNTIACMPLELLVWTKNGKQEAWSNQISKVLRDPAVEESPTLFWKTLVRMMLATGNAYVFKHKYDDEVASLELIDPTLVNIRRSESGRKIFQIIAANRDKQYYTEDDIIHIPFIEEGYNGTKGSSPVDIHNDVVRKNNLINEYVSIYFKNGIGSRLLVELGEKYEPGNPKLEQLMQAFNQYFNEFVLGFENAGRPIVTPPNTKISKIEQGNNVQADVLNLLEESNAEIYRLFNIPPEILNSKESKYNSLEQKQEDFYLRCIKPLCNHIASSLLKGLMKPEEWGRFLIEFDISGLLELDPEKKMNYYLKAYQGGLINLREFRERMGMTRIENDIEGDTRWVPANLIPATADNIQAILAKSKLALEEAKSVGVEKKEENNLNGHNDNGVQDKLI